MNDPTCLGEHIDTVASDSSRACYSQPCNQAPTARHVWLLHLCLTCISGGGSTVPSKICDGFTSPYAAAFLVLSTAKLPPEQGRQQRATTVAGAACGAACINSQSRLLPFQHPHATTGNRREAHLRRRGQRCRQRRRRRQRCQPFRQHSSWSGSQLSLAACCRTAARHPDPEAPACQWSPAVLGTAGRSKSRVMCQLTCTTRGHIRAGR